MTDSTFTALLLVIDRSGSMSTIRDDMVGGLTELLRNQAAEPGRATVDVVLFDDRIETTVVVRIEVEPRGRTALHDALGRSIDAFGARLAALNEADRPGTVIVVVATDGRENASREFTGEQVRAMVERQQHEYAWDFVFLGANQDAVTTGGALGFRAENALDFDADSGGAQAVTVSASAHISRLRTGTRTGFTPDERRRSKR